MRTPIAISVAALVASVGSGARADDKPDLAALHRIKQEAFRRGQVMDHLFWLTDVNGPRLTGSPGFASAAAWAVRALAGWGAANARVEPWGRFGRSWAVTRYELDLVAPTWARLGGVPKAWTSGTKGRVAGALVLAPLYPEHADRDDAYDLAKLAARIRDYEKAWRGKLKGKFVLVDPKRDLALPKEPADPSRYDDKKLGELAQSPEPAPPEPWEWPLEKLPRDPKKLHAMAAQLPVEVRWDFLDRRRRATDELWRFFKAEGALAVLSTDDRGDGALVFAESSASSPAGRSGTSW